MKRRIDVINTQLDGVKILQRNPIGDHRGYFERLFCADELAEYMSGLRLEQINHTQTERRHTIRGMHFQHPPHAETKIVSCIRGKVFDVAVDLRFGSRTYLKWHAEELTSNNHRSLLIPEGFAHGFQTLTDDCELIYLHTSQYVAEAEDGLSPLDPMLAIEWPKPVACLSDRDSNHPHINKSFNGIKI